jgi:hypothetical protein
MPTFTDLASYLIDIYQPEAQQGLVRLELAIVQIIA